jgi:hypothetical protein
MFEHPSCKENIIYYYKSWQEGYESIKNDGLVTHWVNEAPTVEDIKEKTLAHKERGSVIIIDDFLSQVNKEMTIIFSVLSHHTNSVVILLAQNVFAKNPFFREISLNSTYIIIFKNPRDASQITHFAKQFSPNNIQYIVDSYREATKTAYSYLMFDSHQSQLEIMRVRSNILPSDAPMRIWIPKMCELS